MDHDLITKAFKAVQQGQPYAFATIVEATLKGTPRKSGAKMLVLKDGTSYGTIGGGRYEKAAIEACQKAIKSGKSSLVTYNYFGREGQSICGGQIKVFIEPSQDQNNLIICGAGHIALPLSFLAKMLNFKVTILDNRKSYAHKRRFPHVDTILVGAHKAQLAKLKITQNTFIVIVTQGNEFDFVCLKAVIDSDAGYIGVISSKAKKIKFFKRLKELGVSESRLRKIHIPTGIDIGAQTPEEIAVSITAELIAVKNQEALQTEKFKNK